MALGEYLALQEHLKAESEITLEHERKLMEVEQERYELMKSGKLPGMEPEPEPAAATIPYESFAYTQPVTKAEAGIDYKKFILPAAILAFILLRKK